MARVSSNCTIRSSPWMNSWYAAKVGGWPAPWPTGSSASQTASRAWPSPAAARLPRRRAAARSAPPPARARATPCRPLPQRFGPGTGCCPPGDSRRRRPPCPRPSRAPGSESRRRRDGRACPPGATDAVITDIDDTTSTRPVSRGPASPNRPPCGPRCRARGPSVVLDHGHDTRCWLSCDRYGAAREPRCRRRAARPQSPGRTRFCVPAGRRKCLASARSCDRPALRARPQTRSRRGTGHRAAGPEREKSRA